MPISIDTCYLADGTLRPNLTGIAWALWPTRDITQAPGESGTGLTSDAGSAITIPSTASAGIFMLRIDDTNMGLYDTAEITQAVGQPDVLQWYEPFPGFYLLSWQEPPQPVEGYIVYRDGNIYGATSLRVFAAGDPGTYVVRATRNGVLSPPTNPVTIP